MRNYDRLFEVKSIRPDPLGKMFVLKISARAVLDTAFRFHVHVMFLLYAVLGRRQAHFHYADAFWFMVFHKDHKL